MTQIHQLSSTNYGLVSSVLNRVNYIHQDVMMKMHADPDALEHLPSALRQIIEENADFTVFDMILFGKATDLLTRMLLMSTIWFDGTNGRAFVSHYDDGLAHSSFYLLGQVLPQKKSGSQHNNSLVCTCPISCRKYWQPYSKASAR